jgi:hypothetical protein
MTLNLNFFFETMSLINEYDVMLKRERGYDRP